VTFRSLSNRGACSTQFISTQVPFRPVRQLSEYKGKGASASREVKENIRISMFVILGSLKIFGWKEKNHHLFLMGKPTLQNVVF